MLIDCRFRAVPYRNCAAVSTNWRPLNLSDFFEWLVTVGVNPWSPKYTNLEYLWFLYEAALVESLELNTWTLKVSLLKGHNDWYTVGSQLAEGRLKAFTWRIMGLGKYLYTVLRALLATGVACIRPVRGTISRVTSPERSNYKVPQVSMKGRGAFLRWLSESTGVPSKVPKHRISRVTLLSILIMLLRRSLRVFGPLAKACKRWVGLGLA